MNVDEKTAAMIEWQRRWDIFIENVVEEYKIQNNLT